MPKDYLECSGNPDCCPENEGYGCCKPSPPLTDERKLELVSEARSLIRRANEILDYVYADAIKRQAPVQHSACGTKGCPYCDR